MNSSVNRRLLLQTLAAAGPLALAQPAFARGPEAPRIVVIGAGIMGASIAYHLARSGAHVTVLERATPGGGCTQGAFAMLISVHEGGDKAFNDLYSQAVLDWRRLESELGGAVQVQWGGVLTWAAPGEHAETLKKNTDQLLVWGAPLQTVDAAELVRMAPGVTPGPFGFGNFAPDTGTLDPSQALEALVSAAQRAGASFRFPCEARGLRYVGDAIAAVETSQGPIAADVVVLAAGAQAPALAEKVGVKIPINVVSGSLAHSKPFPRTLSRVLNGPLGSVKQDPDGRIVTGLDYRPDADGTDTSAAYGQRLLDTAAQVVPALKGVELEKMTLGYVPIPADTHPIVGFCAAPKNLYVALTMSGITMAPLMGRFAAAEIAGGVAIETLAGYRPARFA